MGSGGTFTRSACRRTNVAALVSSASESSRGSNDSWKSNVVQSAELDTEINDLPKRQRHRVKLHNPLRSAICRWDEESDLARERTGAGGLKAESRNFKNDSARR